MDVNSIEIRFKTHIVKRHVMYGYRTYCGQTASFARLESIIPVEKIECAKCVEKMMEKDKYCPGDCPLYKTHHYPVTFKLCGEKPLFQDYNRRYLRREDCQYQKEQQHAVQ